MTTHTHWPPVNRNVMKGFGFGLLALVTFLLFIPTIYEVAVLGGVLFVVSIAAAVAALWFCNHEVDWNAPGKGYALAGVTMAILVLVAYALLILITVLAAMGAE